MDRKVGDPDAVVYMGTGLVCSIAGAALIVWGWAGAHGVISWSVAGGAFMAVLGFVILVASFCRYWSKRGRRQFVHQRGLRETSPRGVTTIGFDEADELEYRVTDHYHNGDDPQI
jgi:hypothetical protein